MLNSVVVGEEKKKNYSIGVEPCDTLEHPVEYSGRHCKQCESKRWNTELSRCLANRFHTEITAGDTLYHEQIKLHFWQKKKKRK